MSQLRPTKRTDRRTGTRYELPRKSNRTKMSSEYRDIVLAHNDILQLFCIITSRRRCTSHLEWKWPSGKPRKLSKFSARQIWRKLAYILEQLATQVDRTKIREYSFQLAMLLPELAHVFDQIDCLCKVGFIMDALTKYYNAPSSTFEVNRMALRTFVDEYFTQLQCDLRPLSSDSLEFSRITDYWKLDKSAKDWKVVHAFRIQNKIECRAFLQLKNRKLLWHASSGNNWVTIFRYGLCIEHANHGLYGAGVYFADMPYKSLGYSEDLKSQTNPTRLLLLCDVALGRTKRCLRPDHTAARYVTRRPPLRVYNSCCSNGTYAKNLDGLVDENGAIWPTTSSHSVSGGNYTEYIIYDNTQAKMRYLVQIEKATIPTWYSLNEDYR